MDMHVGLLYKAEQLRVEESRVDNARRLVHLIIVHITAVHNLISVCPHSYNLVLQEFYEVYFS